MKIATLYTWIKGKYARTSRSPLLVGRSAYSFYFGSPLGTSLGWEGEFQSSATFFFYLNTYGMLSLALSIPCPFIRPNVPSLVSPSPMPSVMALSTCTVQVIVGSCRIISILRETRKNLDMCLSADNFKCLPYFYHILEMPSKIIFKMSSSRLPSITFESVSSFSLIWIYLIMSSPPGIMDRLITLLARRPSYLGKEFVVF